MHPPGAGATSGVSSGGPVVVSLHDQSQIANGSLIAAPGTPQQGGCVLCVLLILIYKRMCVLVNIHRCKNTACHVNKCENTTLHYKSLLLVKWRAQGEDRGRVIRENGGKVLLGSLWPTQWRDREAACGDEGKMCCSQAARWVEFIFIITC